MLFPFVLVIYLQVNTGKNVHVLKSYYLESRRRLVSE